MPNTNFLSLLDVLKRKSELPKIECEAQAFFMGENKIYAQTSRNMTDCTVTLKRI